MMDKIDFELCLNVEELAAQSRREKLAASSSMCGQDESSGGPGNSNAELESASRVDAPKVRSWGEMAETLDEYGDGSGDNDDTMRFSARKRSRVSVSGEWRDIRDCDMADTQGRRESQQQAEVEANVHANVSADDSRDYSSIGTNSIPPAIGITTTVVDVRYDQDQARLPLTPLPFGPVGSQTATKKENAVSSSSHRSEKQDDKAPFKIYEDPQDMSMDTNMQMHMDVEMDYDNGSNDSHYLTEDSQQWTWYSSLSDDKENTDESYDDEEEEEMQIYPRIQTQTSLDEVGTDSDTDTLIQGHAQINHIVHYNQMDEEGETTMETELDFTAGFGGVEEEDGDIDDYSEDAASFTRDQPPTPVHHQSPPLNILDITNNENNHHDHNIPILLPQMEPRFQPRASLDSLSPVATTEGFSLLPLPPGINDDNGNIHNPRPGELGSSSSSSYSSSTRRRAVRRSYRYRAFN